MRALLMSSILTSSLLLAGAAAAQSTIRPGQTVTANFSGKDARMDDGSHYRCYVVQTQPEMVYTVTMRSDDFDSYLMAGPGLDCEETSISNDDGPDMGTDAQLRFRSSGGSWVIRANTLSEGETGSFRLSVSDGQRMRPTTQIVPITVGESHQGRLEFSDRQADDGSYYDCYALTISQAGKVAVRMDSSEFDSYLALHEGPQCDGDNIASDDDSGGGLSAMIVQDLRPGSYSFRANSLRDSQEGDYTVTVSTMR